MTGRNVGKTCRTHYRGTFNDGTQFDSSYDRGEPLEFVCGAGQMIKGFDTAVADMEVGEIKEIHLMPEEAYGMPNPNMILTLEIANLPGSEDLEVGQQVYLTNQSGQPFPVKVTAKDEKMITLDANHEMAGKELNFKIELVEVTPLEIFSDREGEIILKKYSPMMELNAFAGQYADAMAQSTGLMVCITDRDQVVAAAGGAKKDFLQKPISRALEHVIQERMTVQAGKDERAFTPVTDDDSEGITAQVITPIICEGDAIGSVIVMSREPRAKFADAEVRLAATAAGFLGRQMES